MKKNIEICFLLLYLFNLVFFRVLVSEDSVENTIPTWILMSLGYFLFSGFLYKSEPHFRFQKIASFTYGLVISILVLLAFMRLSSPHNLQTRPIIIVSLLILSCAAILTLLIKIKAANPNQYLKNIFIRFIIVFVFIIPILFSSKKLIGSVFYNPNSFLFKVIQIQLSEEEARTSDDYKAAISILSSTLKKYNSIQKQPIYQRAMAQLGYNYYMNQEYVIADSILNTVVEKHIDDEAYLDALYFSGLLHSTWGNFQQSDSIFSNCLHFNSNPSRFVLYQIFYRMANNAKGLGLYHKSDSIYKSLIETKDYKDIIGLDFYTRTLFEQAANYSLMNDYTNAVIKYKDLMDFLREQNPDTYMESLLLAEFAQVYLTMGNYTKALSLSNQSISRNLDTFYFPYFFAIGVKSSTLMSLSKYKEAELLLNEANDLIETDGVTSEEYSTYIYNALFELLMTYENYNKAAIFLNNSATIMLNKYGPKNLNLASTYCRIGDIQYHYKNYNDASLNYNHGFNIYKTKGASNTLNYMILINNYARIGIETGEYQDVLRLLNYVESKINEYVGIIHPNYATVLINLGINELKNGDKAKAKEYLEKSKGIIEKTLGIRSLKYADILVALSQIDKTMAKEYKLQALSIYRAVLPAHHSKINDLIE